MTKQERERLKIKRESEMRTKEISKMISEGGLGSDKYYEIEKETEQKTEEDSSNKTSPEK